MKKFLVVFLSIISSLNAYAEKNQDAVFNPNQTSATLLISYAKSVMDVAEEDEKIEAEKKYLLTYDIYIKARSYAILNKIFFCFSIVFGLLVLLWPSLSIIFKSKISGWEWVKSATVQTTVTGIAVLMFAFYSQYKEQQTYAETLMRHVVYSEETTRVLSKKVSEELSRIDRGFSFNSIISGESANVKK
ncbi:MAG: hypothetical protein JKX75_08280 [Gammaproteobacteria bacterium]|nr:hypothetical protein [Gammaproteobacteria bacterium]